MSKNNCPNCGEDTMDYDEYSWTENGGDPCKREWWSMDKVHEGKWGPVVGSWDHYCFKCSI